VFLLERHDGSPGIGTVDTAGAIRSQVLTILLQSSLDPRDGGTCVEGAQPILVI
jgi:hypothetical protein